MFKMKKIKVVLTSGAFALALVLSFAFTPKAAKFSNAFIKDAQGHCTVPVTCLGGTRTCVISTKTAYLNAACTITATMPVQ
jgi:hypothetical protein